MEAERLIKYLIPGGIIIIVFGTIGYVVIENASVFDALYMTFITITTVGYGEIIPLHQAGRIFTIVLLTTGMGFLLMAIGIVTQVALEGRLRRLLGRRILNRQIDRLHDHFILCGYGRMGHVIVSELVQKKAPLVVVEKHEALTRDLEEMGVLYVQGSSHEEHVLLAAGVQKAKSIILALGTDADAVFTILLVRELNPDIEIVARALDENAIRQLKAAGATRIVSPYATVGKSMANAVLHPEVMDLMDMAFLSGNQTIRMEGCAVGEGSELAGRTLREAPIRQKLGLIIIGIKKPDGRMLFNPSPDDVIEPGDFLITMGEADNLDRLTHWLNPQAE